METAQTLIKQTELDLSTSELEQKIEDLLYEYNDKFGHTNNGEYAVRFFIKDLKNNTYPKYLIKPYINMSVAVTE